MLPEQMRAIIAPHSGGVEELQPVFLPVPSPNQNEILIQIHAAGVNRPDIAQRQGTYPPPAGASPVLGLEIAGVVVACGSSAHRFKKGDKVTALLSGGGYAEFATVDERNALPLPQGYGFIEASALPETFFTVWSNVFDIGQLQKGEVFLVHGGTSGIGTTAIQLAKAFGATVITTAGSSRKCEACLQLGADLAINYKEEDFVAQILAFTHHKGANVILDMVGGDYTYKNYKCAAEEGRIVQIAFLQGHKALSNLALLMTKRLYHTGSTLRNRSIDFKAKIASDLYQYVWPLLETKKVSPLIDRVFTLEEVAQAHARMESSEHIGKIILKVV